MPELIRNGSTRFIVDDVDAAVQAVARIDTIDRRRCRENPLERDDHKLKELIVNPGERLSPQKHRRRAEHWTVVSGEALVTVGAREFPLKPGQSVHVPRGAVHRIMNPADMLISVAGRGASLSTD